MGYILANPEQTLGSARKFLALVDEEDRRYGGLGVLALNAAFTVLVAHGDQARASVFAQRIVDLFVVCEGDDSPNVEIAKGYVEGPDKHEAYGETMKWKRALTRVEKKGKNFEDWLWKNAR
jgi:hypothetical protein